MSSSQKDFDAALIEVEEKAKVHWNWDHTIASRVLGEMVSSGRLTQGEYSQIIGVIGAKKPKKRSHSLTFAEIVIGVVLATLVAGLLNEGSPQNHESWILLFVGNLGHGICAPVYFINFMALCGGGASWGRAIIDSAIITIGFWLPFYSNWWINRIKDRS